MRRVFLIATVSLAALSAGCDMLGIDTPEKVAAARDADGRAIGAACRQAGRALEDCFALNKKADRAAIFAGWRDMNDYMRENKIDTVTPQLTTQVARARTADADGGDRPERSERAAEKSADKADKPEKASKADKSDRGERSDKNADKNGDKSADKNAAKSEKPGNGEKATASPTAHAS